jgi:hypothetical protein
LGKGGKNADIADNVLDSALLGDLCVKILAKLSEVACQQCNEGNVSWPAEPDGEKRNERKGAGWLIGATGLFHAEDAAER